MSEAVSQTLVFLIVSKDLSEHLNNGEIEGSNPLEKQLINQFVTGFNNSLFGEYEGSDTFTEHLEQGFLNIGRYIEGHGSFADLKGKANFETAGAYWNAYSRTQFSISTIFYYHKLWIKKE